jgi:hypothetical protein
MKTVRVRAWGKMVRAFAEYGRVWVEDDVANHFTTLHSLTDAQRKRVIRLASRENER